MPSRAWARETTRQVTKLPRSGFVQRDLAVSDVRHVQAHWNDRSDLEGARRSSRATHGDCNELVATWRTSVVPTRGEQARYAFRCPAARMGSIRRSPCVASTVSKRRPRSNFTAANTSSRKPLAAWARTTSSSKCVCDECNHCFSRTIDLKLARDSAEAIDRINKGLKPAAEFESLGRRSTSHVEFMEGHLAGGKGYNVASEGDGLGVIAFPQVWFGRSPDGPWDRFLADEVLSKAEMIARGYERGTSTYIKTFEIPKRPRTLTVSPKRDGATARTSAQSRTRSPCGRSVRHDSIGEGASAHGTVAPPTTHTSGAGAPSCPWSPRPQQEAYPPPSTRFDGVCLPELPEPGHRRVFEVVERDLDALHPWRGAGELVRLRLPLTEVAPARVGRACSAS